VCLRLVFSGMRKQSSMEIKPEEIMKERGWDEGWKEEEWEIAEVTECPKCGSKLEIKGFDVDFLNSRITVHGFEKMYCPKCGYVFMNSKQAQLYEDLLDYFLNIDKLYYSTVQKKDKMLVDILG
jgi:ribosomal protein S27AE